jgi:hypothetical protein
LKPERDGHGSLRRQAKHLNRDSMRGYIAPASGEDKSRSQLLLPDSL